MCLRRKWLICILCNKIFNISAAAVSTESLTKGSSSLDGSVEDLSFFEDEGLYSSGFNDLVQLCPFFRNEIGGEREQVVCISSSGTNTSHHFTVSVQVSFFILYMYVYSLFSFCKAHHSNRAAIDFKYKCYIDFNYKWYIDFKFKLHSEIDILIEHI